jgi:hypothetical protein
VGHHSAAFTLSVYTHLLPGDEIAALDVRAEIAEGQRRGNTVTNSGHHDLPSASALAA